MVGLAQNLIELLRTTNERHALWYSRPWLPPDGAHLHIEGPCTARERFSNVAKAEIAKCLARQLWPKRRRGCPYGPLALPLALAKLGIDTPERARKRDHCSNNVLRNPGFM